MQDQKQAERDFELIKQLTNIRSSLAEASHEIDPFSVNRRFQFAFKRYELDVDATPVEAAIARLGSRPKVFVGDVVAGLDHWLLFRRAIEHGAEKVLRLVELLKGLDPEPERSRLRALLAQSDLRSHRGVLLAMADRAEAIESNSSTPLLLARSLDKAGESKRAIAILRAAVSRYPGDAWANFELAKLLRYAKPPQPEDAIRYYTAARALRPETGLDLAETLREQRRNDEAEAIYRELVRGNRRNFLSLFRFLKVLKQNGKWDEAQSVAERISSPFLNRVSRNPSDAGARQKFVQSLWVTGDHSRAIAEMRELGALCGKDPLYHRLLGHMCLAVADLPGAIAAYRETTRINPLDVFSHHVLAWALGRSGDRAGEIAELRTAVHIQSASESRPHSDRVQPFSGSWLLWVDGAEAFAGAVHIGLKEAWADSFRVKDQLAPTDDPIDFGHINATRMGYDGAPERGGEIEKPTPVEEFFAYNLDNIQYAIEQGLEEGIFSDSPSAHLYDGLYVDTYFIMSFAFIRPHLALGRAHLALGAALAESGDLPGAIADYSEAVRLGEGDAEARATVHDSLGSARWLTGAPSAAIAAFRESIRVNPDGTLEGRYNLSVALAESGDVSGAIAALREAVQRQQPRQAGSFRLLRAIVMSPRPKDAVQALKRVREEARDDGTVRKAIEVTVSQFEQLSKLGVPIPRVFRLWPQGNDYPAHCYSLRLFAASAAIWAAGFAADPTLAQDMQAQKRYLAASAAALASAGQGIDQPPLDELARSRWRKQALDWLNADLAYWSKEAETGVPQSAALARKTLQNWRVDRDLASVRDESHLKRLPQDEQKAWQAFWASVAALLRSANQY